MTASAFVTRIETHRDPTLLWPLVGVLSMLVHGLLWLGVHPLRITPSPTVEPDPIPVQLWLDTPGATEAVEPAPSSAIAASPSTPTVGASPVPPVAPTPNLPPSIPAPEIPSPPPAAASPPPTPTAPVVEPPPPVQAAPVSPAVAPPLSPAPAVPPPTVQPPPAVQPPPVTAVSPPAVAPAVPSAPVEPPPPAANPSGNSGPSQTGGGELSHLGLYAANFGTDFPDTPPRLLDNTSLSLQPWLATCGWENLGAIASPGLTARVKLQLQVQPDGSVAQARVLEGTGNSALDNLVSCVVQHQLQLVPATTAGTPQLTDAFILDTQVSF